MYTITVTMQSELEIISLKSKINSMINIITIPNSLRAILKQIDIELAKHYNHVDVDGVFQVVAMHSNNIKTKLKNISSRRFNSAFNGKVLQFEEAILTAHNMTIVEATLIYTIVKSYYETFIELSAYNKHSKNKLIKPVEINDNDNDNDNENNDDSGDYKNSSKQ